MKAARPSPRRFRQPMALSPCALHLSATYDFLAHRIGCGSCIMALAAAML